LNENAIISVKTFFLESSGNLPIAFKILFNLKIRSFVVNKKLLNGATLLSQK